ncbi:Ig-like domain-containing protein [Vibrio owensii]|uniref:Ig-like domain-containing protein n=1 Tax=Vibrio owensii TaxID=696485 RepID=UPI003DA023FE
MMKIKPSLWALMLTTLTLIGCNNGDEGLTGSAPELPESVSELVVTPKNESLPVGLEWQFKAEAVLNNGEVKNVTTREEITWSSSDDSIASVDTNGIVTAKEGGTVTITASGRSDGTDFIDTAELTVTEAIVTKLVIEPKESDVAIGLPIQYTATAYFSDDTSLNVTTNKNVTWASTSEEVATISNAPENKGEAKGIKEGGTTITATGTLNGVTFDDSTTLTVTGATVTELTISAEEDSIPVGLTTQFTAIATLSNGQNIDVTDFDEITWTSEDASIATIDNETSPQNETVKGRATGINASSSSVNIFARGNINGVDFEVSEPLEVSDATVTKIVVSPENASIPEGLTQQFVAKAYFSDDRAPVDVTEHPDITWTSSNANIALVDNSTSEEEGRVKGLVRGVKASSDSVVIKATGELNGSKFSDSGNIDVSEANLVSITIEPAYIELGLGQDYSKVITAIGHYSNDSSVDITSEVSWNGIDVSIATITNGNITGIDLGETSVIAAFNGIASEPGIIKTSLPICNYTVDDVDQTSAKGFCLKASVTDNKMFTSSPSIKVMDRLGYREGVTVVQAGKTYHGLVGELDSQFATFEQYTGVRGTQLYRWCQDLNERKFGGRDNWRVPLLVELGALIKTKGDLNELYGWPTYERYWSSSVTSTVDSDTFYANIYLDDGGISSQNSRIGQYASCVSDM